MDHRLEIALQRLQLLTLAETLGNISAACRELGYSRTQYYAYLRAYQAAGLQGLKDSSKARTRTPRKLSAAVVAQILDIIIANPERGCDRIRTSLRTYGVQISAPTIQKLLNSKNLGTAVQRVAYAQRHNPLHTQASNPLLAPPARALAQLPGLLLYQDILSIKLKPIPEHVYFHTVIDAYCGFTFAMLSREATSASAALFLETVVLPFYNALALTIQQICTSPHPAFDTSLETPYRAFAEHAHIRHHTLRQQPRHLRKRLPCLSERVPSEALPLLEGGAPTLAHVNQTLDQRLTRLNAHKLIHVSDLGPTTPLVALHVYLCRDQC